MATPLDAASESERNENVTHKVKLNRLRNSGRPLTILVVGPPGVGKTTLINTLLGKYVAEVGHGEKLFISEFEGEYEGVKITAYDTDIGGKSDCRILLDIAKHGHFDLVLLCSKLGDKADRTMFSELASVLNEEIWKRTVVVLTFANHFIQLESVKPKGPEAAIRDKIDQYKAYVVDFLSGPVKKEILQDIPFCIAGRKDEKKLPTTDAWLKTLWHVCIDRSSDETCPLLKVYANHSLAIRIAAVSTGAIFGGGVGAKVGTVVPIVGTALGAGVGAGIGAGVGAIIGGAVGSKIVI